VKGYHGSSDYWVVKLTDAGDISWQKCLGGSSQDVAHSIQQTSDGGYIVAGMSHSSDGDVKGNYFAASKPWVVKLRRDGNISWQKALGDRFQYDAQCIQQTNDGGYIVAGILDLSRKTVNTDYWVVKLAQEQAGPIVKIPNGGIFEINETLQISPPKSEPL
jgi:hypothetical protein